MAKYTIQQCVFLYETYMKNSSTKFPGIHKPFNKFNRSAGSLIDKEPIKKPCPNQNKIDKIRSTLEHTMGIIDTGQKTADFS